MYIPISSTLNYLLQLLCKCPSVSCLSLAQAVPAPDPCLRTDPRSREVSPDPHPHTRPAALLWRLHRRGHTRPHSRGVTTVGTRAAALLERNISASRVLAVQDQNALVTDSALGRTAPQTNTGMKTAAPQAAASVPLQGPLILAPLQC